MSIIHPFPDQDCLVSLKNAGVYKDGKWLIRGVDVCVHKGEIVTLIGPNGSGKSTTAKTLLGVYEPDEGTITRKKNIKIGYVPQKFNVDATIPLNVLRCLNLTGTIEKNKAMAALAQVDAAHLAKREIQTLSGGEIQRVLLARALVRKPDLLVLDEPVQGIDFSGEVALYDLIGSIRDEQGCGIVMISHDLHVVMAQTDTVICLNGHVCCRGTPQSVKDSPEYIRLFGNRLADTHALYTHDHDHTHLDNGKIEKAPPERPDREVENA